MLQRQGPTLVLLATAALGTGAVGCGPVTEPEPTAVIASVQAENVLPGSAATVHLVNNSAHSWTVSPCLSHLQRLDGGGWRSVQLPSCQDAAVLLDGGEPLEIDLEVPLTADFGIYRAVYSSWLFVPGASLDRIRAVPVYSNRFYVPAVR